MKPEHMKLFGLLDRHFIEEKNDHVRLLQAFESHAAEFPDEDHEDHEDLIKILKNHAGKTDQEHRVLRELLIKHVKGHK
jgi:hypothetical protein